MGTVWHSVISRISHLFTPTKKHKLEVGRYYNFIILLVWVRAFFEDDYQPEEVPFVEKEQKLKRKYSKTLVHDTDQRKDHPEERLRRI